MSREFYLGDFPGILSDHFYWRSSGSDGNAVAFEALGIKDKFDKYAYCERIVGYRPSSGDFPYMKNMEDLRKVCESLHKDLVAKGLGIGKANIQIANVPVKVGDFVEITHSDRNFNSLMEKWVGKIVQVQSVSTHFAEGCAITFDDPDSRQWCWVSTDGHFKKVERPTDTIPVPTEEYAFYEQGSKKVEGTLKCNDKGYYWSAAPHYFNPFDGVGSKTMIQQRVLGYHDTNGIFPFCKTREDLIKLCDEVNRLRREQFCEELPRVEITSDRSCGLSTILPSQKFCVVGTKDWVDSDWKSPEKQELQAVTPILIKVCKI